jgi:hypothetical protein
MSDRKVNHFFDDPSNLLNPNSNCREKNIIQLYTENIFILSRFSYKWYQKSIYSQIEIFSSMERYNWFYLDREKVKRAPVIIILRFFGFKPYIYV